MSATINLGRVVGYSAYEVAVQNGFVGTEEEWLESLKGDDGEQGAAAVNPFKGWFTSDTQLIAEYPNPTDGDYAYVQTATDVIVYQANGGQWRGTSKTFNPAYEQTFASGEEVNETYIDDTHLVNPADGALPKAEDVLQLKAKLEGVTASEVKVIPVLNTNYFDGKYVKNDKTIQNGSTPTGGVPNGILIVNVSNVKKVRFLGFERDNATTTGYGFSVNPINPTSTAKQLDYAWAFKGDADSARAVELEVDVPEGMNYFVCTIYKYGTPSSAVMTLNSFYCYLYRGINVSEKMAEVCEEEISKKINEFSLPFTLNSNKSIYGIKYNNNEIGDEVSVLNHHSTSYIEVKGFSKIRFLGLRYKNSFYNGTNLQSGFAFYDENKVALKPYCHAWHLGEDENAEYSGMPYVYEINVPKDACYFRCDTRDFDTTDNFYCIGISNIQGNIDNLDGKTFVNAEPILMSTTFSSLTSTNGIIKSPSFNLVHFSDIHGDTVALQRIVDFRDKFKNYINDVLCTGDNVWYKFGHGMDFWDAVEGSESILNCLGNHDTTTQGSSNWGDVSAENCYNKFFAPYISNWGDVVITENQCYYYKDYPTYGIRLIVLDLYHPDNPTTVSDTLGTAQQTWFENALEGARTAQTPLHVIVAGHAPERNWSGHIDTPFDDLQRANNYVLGSSLPSLGSEAIGAIASFINEGGKFVCYLCGHMHSDSFRKFNGHNDMLYVVVQNASVREHNPGAPYGTIARLSTGPNNTNARVIGEVSEDAFNLISVDTLHTILTITRIGQNYDVFGRHLGSVCYDYTSNRIISQW